MADKSRQSANLVSDTSIYVNPITDNVGIGTTNSTSKLTVAGDLIVSGVVTAASFSGNASSATSVINGIASVTQLNVSGVSTFTNGPVLIGTATSTGTASQPLQVTGGGYVSGNLGVGVLNPTSKVDISGNITVTNSSAAGLNIRSGAAGSFTSFNIGRTGADGTFAVVAAGGQFANDSATGDVVIRTESSTAKLLFTNSATNSTLAIAGNNVLVGSVSSTGTAGQRLQVTGGAYVSGSVGIGTTNPANALTVVGTTDIQGAVETVSVASTSVIGGTKYLLECNAQNGTVFTHSIPSGGNVGIISFRNFPATKNSVTTFTIFVTQNSTGTGNTTAVSGVGTNIQLWPTGATSGLTTSARVSSGSTVVLPTTANDIDIVSFAVHYNGAGAATTTNYTVYVSDMSSFRFGTIRP